MLLGSIFPGTGTDAAVFGVLLTIESLLFAVVGVAATLNGPALSVTRAVWRPSTLAFWLAVLITLVAGAAILMWTAVFDAPFPKDIRGEIVSLIVLVASGAEPILAWIIWLALKPQAQGAPQ